MRAEFDGTRALLLAAARHPHAVAGGTAERDQRGRHAAARALDEHGAAGLCAGVREQHPVRGQPCRREARGLLERQRRRLRDDVAARHDDVLGEGAVVDLREQRPLRVEGLVAPPVVARDHRVHDHLVAVGIDTGGVAAEHHRQPVLRDADAAQRPDVVLVERGGPHRDANPTVGRCRVRTRTDDESRERIVSIDRGGVRGEHRRQTLPMRKRRRLCGRWLRAAVGLGRRRRGPRDQLEGGCARLIVGPNASTPRAARAGNDRRRGAMRRCAAERARVPRSRAWDHAASSGWCILVADRRPSVVVPTCPHQHRHDDHDAGRGVGDAADP